MDSAAPDRRAVEAELHAFTAAWFLKGYGWACLVLGGLQLVLIPIYALDPMYPDWRTMSAINVPTFLVLLLAWGLIRRGAVPVARFQWIGAFCVLVLLVQTLVQMGVARYLLQSSDLILLTVAIGLAFPGRGWHLGLLATVVASWWALVQSLDLPGDRVHWWIAFLAAAAASTVMQRILANLLSTQERLRLEDRLLAQAQAASAARLQEALDNVRMLTGLIPICSSCKKVRDDTGYWLQVETYVKAHSAADFTHSLCPECLSGLREEFIGEVPDPPSGGFPKPPASP